MTPKVVGMMGGREAPLARQDRTIYTNTHCEVGVMEFDKDS